MVVKIRCNRCSYFLGEDSEALELIAVVKERDLGDRIKLPRRSWKCPNCGWLNVFRPLKEVEV